MATASAGFHGAVSATDQALQDKAQSRRDAAQAWVVKEIKKLIEAIQTLGKDNKITFGELFEKTQDVFEGK